MLNQLYYYIIHCYHGISDIGVGFGICGILISLGNLFGGVFESDDDINHYVRAVDNEHEHK